MGAATTGSSTGNGTTTSGAATTKEQKVSGSMVLTMATKTECDNLASTKGITGMKNMLRDKGKLGSSFSLSKIAVTVTCAKARRLSVEGRRLTSYKGTLAYTITVPKGSTVSADQVKNSINSVTDATWKSSVKSYAAAQGVTVTVTALTVTKAGVSNTSNDASFAKSTGLMVGMMMMFRALL